MAIEILRPISDRVVQWTPNSGTDNFAMVDEAVADDLTTYVYGGEHYS